jgi:hypothetical protein
MTLDPLVALLNQREGLTITVLSDHSIQVSSQQQELLLSTQTGQKNAWVIPEDWVHETPQIVASKVINRLGLSQRIHARKCKEVRVDKPIMNAFLADHHLNGPAGAKHKFGLTYEDELVAIATFATPRILNGKKSAELVRFCIKSYCSIPGGLDKLLKHYQEQYPCDDIFTYVDLAWSSGAGFKNIGFQEEGVKEIAGKQMLRLRLTIDRNSSHPHT